MFLKTRGGVQSRARRPFASSCRARWRKPRGVVEGASVERESARGACVYMYLSISHFIYLIYLSIYISITISFYPASESDSFRIETFFESNGFRVEQIPRQTFSEYDSFLAGQFPSRKVSESKSFRGGKSRTVSESESIRVFLFLRHILSFSHCFFPSGTISLNHSLSHFLTFPFRNLSVSFSNLYF